jgi:predicted amidohydrolase YtcJ
VFVDTATSLATSFVPEPSLEERRAALIAASKLALTRGVTSVVDFGRFSPGETAQQAWDDFNEEIPCQPSVACWRCQGFC